MSQVRDKTDLFSTQRWLLRCSFSSTCPGIFVTLGSGSQCLRRAPSKQEDFLGRRGEACTVVRSRAPRHGEWKRRVTPAWGPCLPRQGDWKRHPVWRWWNTTKLSECSPPRQLALENSWRFLKTSRRRRRWKCFFLFSPTRFFYHIRLVASNYVYAQFRDLQLCLHSSIFCKKNLYFSLLDLILALTLTLNRSIV